MLWKIYLAHCGLWGLPKPLFCLICQVAAATQWTPPGSSCSGLASEVCRNLQNNYLLGGGGRAVDRQREDALTRMNAAAIKVNLDLQRSAWTVNACFILCSIFWPS